MAAQARSDTGEEARLLAHWQRLSQQYMAAYGGSYFAPSCEAAKQEPE